MRSITSKRSIIQCPLNELMGARTHVRILRILAGDGNSSFSVSDLARGTGITYQGVTKALNVLTESGYVETRGSGHGQHYALSERAPLARALQNLFETERGLYEEFMLSLKSAASESDDPPISVWIDSFPTVFGDPIEVGLLHNSRMLDTAVSAFRLKLVGLESTFDVTIETKGYTRADLPALDSKAITLVYGSSPVEEFDREKRPRKVSHLERDLESLERSKGVAMLVKRDRSLVRRAMRHVEQLLEVPQGMATRDIQEWKSILETYSPPRFMRFLTSTSPRAIRLRQSNPFFAVLTPEEKRTLSESIREGG